MNNPNPFLPQGSLLEQQSHRRSRLKIAVSCVLAVSVIGLVTMLIQGCHREKPDTEQTPPPLEFGTAPLVDTNPPMSQLSNPPVVMPQMTNPPMLALPPVVEPVAPPAVSAGSEYTIVSGDTLAVIAKKNGVSLSALQAANPGVVPTKLKIGQKITIPAGSTSSGTMMETSSVDSGVTVYTVKSGDTLTKVAKAHGTSVKAIQSENGLKTTAIKVGQKLKIPSKAPAISPIAPPAPLLEPAPAPQLPSVTVPSAPAPAPTH
jgi:LysM repeat protein